jgi:AcrR family transcriptional regulator
MPGNGATKDTQGYRWSDRALDRREQYRLRKTALLKMAARAFNETSYYTTTLDDLAKRLNVTKPTLYYYVKSKDDILFECQNIAFEYIKGALAEAENSDKSGMEKLQHFLARYARMMTEDSGACLIRTGLKPLKPESREKLKAFAKRLDAALRGIVEAGIADGSIRPCNSRLAANAIFSGFAGIAQWFDSEGDYGIDEVTEAYLDLFKRGLTPGKSPQ